MDREDALKLVKNNVYRPNLFKHILAVEAILRSVAEKINEDIEEWGLLGLLHDLDFEETYDKPKLHAIKSADLLKGKVDDQLLTAIKAHNYENTGVKPNSKLDNALIAADAVSGLIVACALVMPNKKLAEVQPTHIMKKFKEKDFARNCNRTHMLFCKKLGLTWSRFSTLALRSLQNISEDLNL